MGLVNSKEYFQKRKIDQATSNTSLSKLRYVTIEKPKWKVFAKKEVRPIPLYQTTIAPRKGCLCGGSSRCKQTVTPKGVTIHYPHKKKIFGLDKRYKPPSIDKGYLSNKDREINRVKIVRPKKFPIPTWRVDKMLCDTPFQRPNIPENVTLEHPQPILMQDVPTVEPQPTIVIHSPTVSSSILLELNEPKNDQNETIIRQSN